MVSSELQIADFFPELIPLLNEFTRFFQKFRVIILNMQKSLLQQTFLLREDINDMFGVCDILY